MKKKYQKQNSLTFHQVNKPRILSFQKKFSNINGRTHSSSKKIISNGHSGKMYLNNNGLITTTDLNYEQLKKEFNFPSLMINSEKIFKMRPRISNENNNFKYLFTPKQTPLFKKFNWNTLLLLLIFFLLIFISIKVTFKKDLI